MAIDISTLINTMLNAAKPVLKEKWPEIEDYAETEFKKIAENIVRIEKMKLAGTVTEEKAKIYLDMQKNSTRAVILTVEGLGIIAVEQAINSALAAVKDVVKDGQNGVMFEAGDSLALANNLEKLLIDDELCKRLSEVGHDFVKSEFDWSVVGNEYRRLLKLLVT